MYKPPSHRWNLGYDRAVLRKSKRNQFGIWIHVGRPNVPITISRQKDETFGRPSGLSNNTLQASWGRFQCHFQLGCHPCVAQEAPGDSFTWKRMLRVRESAEQNMLFLIRNANSSFWFDTWTDHGPLFNMVEHVYDSHLSVRQVWNSSNSSLLDGRYSSEELRNIGNCIKDKVICQRDSDSDKLIWTLTSNGSFSISSTYSPMAQSFTRQMIWDKRLQLKISIFMWKLLNIRLPTDDLISKIGIPLPSKCRFCNNEKSINHRFVVCTLATQVWSFFEEWFEWSFAPATTISDKLNLWWWAAHAHSTTMGAIHKILPCIVCWFIWKSRNNATFQGTSISATRIIVDICAYLKTVSSIYLFPKVIATDELLLSHEICSQLLYLQPRRILAVKWNCPPYGVFKLNADGASKGNPGLVAGRGILRNHHGHCIKAFSNVYSSQTNLKAEVLALVDGLKMCCSLHLRAVEVEMDSLILVNIMKGLSAPPWSIDNELQLIKRLLEGSVVSFSHAFRETNQVADRLANEGISTPMYVEYDPDTIPSHVKGLVILDAKGHPYIRLCKS